MSNKPNRFGLPKGIIHSNQSSFSTLYRLVDTFLITCVFFTVLFSQHIEIGAESLLLASVSIISFMFLAEAVDLYRSWRTASNTLMIKYIVAVWTIICLSTFTFAYLFPQFVPYKTHLILSWMLITGLLLIVWRIIFREILFYYRKSGHNTKRAVVIGATSAGYSLANQIVENAHLGLIFSGLFDDRSAERLPHEFQNQILGDIKASIELAKSNQIDQVYIALPMSAEKRIVEILNLCSDTTATVLIIPNFFMYNLLNARWQNIGSMQTLSVYDTPFQGAWDVLKRLEDIVISSFILTVISMPMLLIAIGIKLTSKGPIIFKQNRYGLDGKQITVYKFRSMSTQDNGDTIKQATRNDSRITPFGAFLRRTSLDELPQFINVLQGRMSIVGPRPHAVAHNEQYRKLVEGYMLRHKVKPGITGWAQINGFRGETKTIDKMVKRVEYDLDYIHRWSIWMDFRIILTTIYKGFVDKNAY